MNVVVDGLMTSYTRAGNGKVILCLPGWADTGASFSKLTEHLQDGYEVITLDMPGFGDSQAPPHAWGLSDYAEFIADWLKKLKISSVYGLVGHSYGGAVAIASLSKDHLKADKLILLASAGIRTKKPARKRLLKAVAKAGKLPLMMLPAGKRQKLRKRFYRAIGSDLTLLPHMELTFKRIIEEDVQTMAKNVTIPTLLAYGSKDRDTPEADGRRLQKIIPHSRLVKLEAGHFLHQEQPAAIAKLITNFLEEKN